MIITHKLQSMDLTHKQNTSRIDVVQDDKYSRDVEFTLTENGVAWQIPDGTTAVVRYKKPDGTGGNYDALPDGSTAYQINGNVLTVAMAPQVCTVTGSVQLSVGLIQGNAEINTFSVNIVVHPNPGAEYQSEDYIKLSGAVPNSGWTPNMYLGTDASGNVVAKEGTGGGGSTSGKDGGYYTPSVTQPDENTMRVSYTPSESSMPEVESMDVMLPTGTDGKSAYQYAVEGGYTGTETEFAAKLAEEMPDKLPNPNALTFTGAVTGSYDGSAPLNVEIPSGGDGSGGAVRWKLIRTINIVSGTSSYSFNTDNNGNAFKVKNFLILIDAWPVGGSAYLEIKPNGNFSFAQKPKGKQDYPFSFMMKRLTDKRYILENSISNQSTFERKISGEYSSFGEFTSFSFWFSAGAASDTTMYILGEDV